MRGFLFVFGLFYAGWIAEAAILYSEDFSKTKVGSGPDTMLVLGGKFEVRMEGKESFLKLPGNPLDLHGVMFGPSKKDGVLVHARVLGKRRGRRSFPVFGVGLNGVSGYRVMVSPAKQNLALYKGETVVKVVPFTWKYDRWTHVRLQITKTEDGWILASNAWAQGDKPPEKSLLIWKDKEAPLAGRMTAWGVPYSGTPIFFDDLKVIKFD